MTYIKIIYTRPRYYSDWCGEYKGGLFKSSLNLACFDKKLFSSLEIDSDLTRLNTIVAENVYTCKYFYLPCFIFLTLGVIITILGLATSFASSTPNWTLVVGLLLLLLSTFAFIGAKIGATCLQRKAFNLVELALVELNNKYQARSMKWRIAYPKSKQTVVTAGDNSGHSFDFFSCLDVQYPTIYIDLPSNDRLLVDTNQNVQIEMANTSQNRVKKVYCTHCGLRSPAPNRPLKHQPLCSGCNRSLDLPARYFAVDSAEDFISSSCSSPSFSIPNSVQSV